MCQSYRIHDTSRKVTDQGVIYEHPNKTTLAAMEEAIRIANDPNTKRFATVDELMEDLRK